MMVSICRGFQCRKSTQAFVVSVPLVMTMYLYMTFANKNSSDHQVTSKLVSNTDTFYKRRSDVTQGRFNVDRRLNESFNSLADFRKMFKTKKKDLSDDVFKISRSVEYTNCAALFNGNENEINNTISMYDNNETMHDSLEPEDYFNMTSSCANFTRERHYITEPLNQEENDFPIAYSILMYTDIEQFERLLRTIYRPQNSYCIHVDLNSRHDVLQAVKAIAKCFPNVYLTYTRLRVVWGTMSVLKPELLCMRLLYAKNQLWKYFINLTGQEFPLKTNYELVKILKAYNGANDVEGTRRRANKNRWENRGEPPHGVIPTKGQVHAILCRGFVRYILEDPRARDLLNWVETTDVPDETFFASLNHNPHLEVPGSYMGIPETDDSVKPYLARYKNWGDYACHGKFLRGICIFGVGDLPVLARRVELFANKFLWEYQRATLECLEELLYNRTRDEYLGRLDFDAGMYGSLGFVVNQIRLDNNSMARVSSTVSFGRP